jgi:hypothetical protein
MDTSSKQQYMETLQTEYSTGTKKEKTKILDEYCKRTGEERKYATKKLRGKVRTKKPHERKKRPKTYQGDTVATLTELWTLFDRPCGQRIVPLLRSEVDRLRSFTEITCSDTVAEQLKTMSSATIDRCLAHEKEVLRLTLKHKRKTDTSLLSHVPMKTVADLDKQIPGSIQIDCVEHCGLSASGDYINSLTTIDIATGWWEGAALMGKGAETALCGLETCRDGAPLAWREMHPDNGSNILNWHVVRFAEKHGIELSRSRPYKKNDNCYVEQKNRTHVRKPFGYLRFDTREEQEIMNDLYRGELRLFKNFFQPVMKLTEKVRLKGKIHRKYDVPLTPYQRVLASPSTHENTKHDLMILYDTLNPALLKRSIDGKIKNLYDAYQSKNGSRSVDADKKITPALVSYYLMQQL